MAYGTSNKSGRGKNAAVHIRYVSMNAEQVSIYNECEMMAQKLDIGPVNWFKALLEWALEEEFKHLKSDLKLNGIDPDELLREYRHREAGTGKGHKFIEKAAEKRSDRVAGFKVKPVVD